MVDGSLDFSQGYRDAKETRFQDVRDGDILSISIAYPSFIVRTRRNGGDLSFQDLRTGLREEFLTQLILGSKDARYKIGFPTKLLGEHEYLEFLEEDKPVNRYLSLSTENHRDGRRVLVGYPHVLDEKDIRNIEDARKENKARTRNYLNYQRGSSDKGS